MVALSGVGSSSSSVSALIQRRDFYYCDEYGDCYTSWDVWGRWVALAFIFMGLVFILLVSAAISARRRKAAGVAPYYGTSWAAPKYNTAPQYQYTGNDAYAQPAPPYSPPPMGYPNHIGTTGTTWAPNTYELQGLYQPHPGQAGIYDRNQNPTASGAYVPPRSPTPAHTVPDKM